MQQPAYDFVLRSRRVVTPEGIRPAAVAVRGETIAAVLAPDAVPPDAAVRDVGDAVILPGVVDTHAHINEPGRTEWEGFETATQAAAAGGITTVVDMPLNCIPVTTTAAALDAKRAAADGRTWIDHGFWGGLVPGNTRELEPLIRAGVLGFKAFMVHSGIDDFPAADATDLRAGMPVLAAGGVPLLVHAEVECVAPPREADTGDPRAYATYLASRPAAWETEAVRRMVALARETRCAVHVVHLSAAEALAEITRAQREGLAFSAETCPHYLVLRAEDVPDGATEYKCAPPIRGGDNQERLWQALVAGDIAQVVSDHSPCTPALKLQDSGDFRGAWGGIASLQFGLSLIWTQARARGLTLAHLARWMSAAPARLAGLAGRKGEIRAGCDADLVVFDPDARFTLTRAMVRHRHPVTPYLGRDLYGAVQRTYLRGRVIYENGEVVGGAGGRALARATTGAQYDSSTGGAGV